ncbi:transposase [Marinobacter sp. M3C]|uniref:IS66 family transposase n=1 Tax=Marinobacter sp. M3C TaxID=2917715 RepID=UPI00200F0A85|nr:transposase [Marinobacter sp. M3C]UQG58667.1 transposase [Marinobacter sp. M3C]
MKIENIDVDSAIGSVKKLLEKERDLSPSLKAALEVLLLLVAMLLNRTTLNSKNSSKPPSSDPNREKSSRKGEIADAGGRLPATDADPWRQRYRRLLEEADSECPPPDESPREEGKRGRLKRSKARNLLERLRHFEHDVLRFMDVEYVPFTNNQGENDLRMTKVQQKISGCFRSMEGAKIFCRVRSYLSTCRKQGMSATEALALLFQGKNPAFMDTEEAQF